MSDLRNPPPQIADTSSLLLAHALSHASAEDLREALDWLARGSEPLPIGGPDATAPYRSIALVLNRQLRTLQAAGNAVDRARGVAELAGVKRRLLLRYLTLRAEAEAGAEDPPKSRSFSLAVAIERVYRLFAARGPSAAEVDLWQRRLDEGLPFHEFMLAMEKGEEGRPYSPHRILPDLKDAELVQFLFETVLERGAHPREIDHWTARLRSGGIDRVDLTTTVLETARQEQSAAAAVHDGLSCRIMGTNRDIGVGDWKQRAQAVGDTVAPTRDPRHVHRFALARRSGIRVSAIASLYRGGDFIERFMDNITTQSIFDQCCELIIVDADSPDDEARTIRRYLAGRDNIKYLRMDSRIGIYEAWNIGVREARGDYLTNTNLDDLRRRDSFELQAGALDALDFVDVVYQDFYYSFDPALSWERIAAFGYKSDLPVVTPSNLLHFNSPHNAPMWRRRLHDTLGPFDAHFRSAGDYDFWLRCMAAGKVFYKLNDPHVVYYQNPKGLSTRPDSRGVVEAREVSKRYARQLTAPEMLLDADEFLRQVCPHAIGPAEGHPLDRYALVQQELRQAAARLKP